jgi:DNA-binding transcriptional ArsR family regulator
VTTRRASAAPSGSAAPGGAAGLGAESDRGSRALVAAGAPGGPVAEGSASPASPADAERRAAPGSSPDLGAVFGALADATRRDVLRRLAGAGHSVTASALAADLPMTRQAVAKHLRALADAGLVVARREGRETHFRAVPGALDDAVAWMATTGARWDGRLDRLRQKVEGG